MYGLWTSCLILIMTYPGYLVWKPPGDFPLAGMLKTFYHSILYILVQIPALGRRMKTPSGGLIALSIFYWVFFFIALYIKLMYGARIEQMMSKASL